MAVRPVLAVAVLAALAAGAVLVSRTGDGDGEPVPGAVRVSAELKKFRARELDRVALVVLRNHGAEPVTLTRVRLVSPELDPAPADESATRLAAGERVDVPVRLGRVTCRTSSLSRGGRRAGVLAQVRVGAGPARVVRLPLPSPDRYLRQVVSVDCQRHTLDEAVQIGFGDRWRPGPGRFALRGEVVMRRRSAVGTVALDELAGSVVFTVHAAAGGRRPVLVLRPDADEARLQVTLRLPSCAPHLLTEAKRGYVFPVHAHVGDGPDLFSTVVPVGRARTELDRLIRTCASGR